MTEKALQAAVTSWEAEQQGSAADMDDRACEPAHSHPHHSFCFPSIVEVAHSTALSINWYKQSHTTLHILLSTNDYSALENLEDMSSEGLAMVKESHHHVSVCGPNQRQ